MGRSPGSRAVGCGGNHLIFNFAELDITTRVGLAGVLWSLSRLPALWFNRSMSIEKDQESPTGLRGR
jgi:hypothetical protein